MNIEEMKARRIECQEVIKARQSELMAERGLASLDDGTDAQWDEIAAVIDATVPEKAEMARLTVEIEETESRETAASVAARKSTAPKNCPNCGHAMTAGGRCDDCDDWDN